MNQNKHSGGAMSGKGYYIALILCAVAIGITSYLYYRNANSRHMQAEGPTDVQLMQSNPGDVEAVATQPGQPHPQTPTATLPVKTKPIKTGYPVDGETVADYAMDCLSYNATTRDWRVHNGIDIAAQAGTKVRAAAAGTVYTTYEDDAMGMTVVISHEDGYVTKYSSLAKDVAVSAGEKVDLGQEIGCVGTTALLETSLGDHVHFGVSHHDEPMDPIKFLDME